MYRWKICSNRVGCYRLTNTLFTVIELLSACRLEASTNTLACTVWTGYYDNWKPQILFVNTFRSFLSSSLFVYLFFLSLQPGCVIFVCTSLKFLFHSPIVSILCWCCSLVRCCAVLSYCAYRKQHIKFLHLSKKVLLTPPDEGPRVKGQRIKLQDIVDGLYVPQRANGSWIDGKLNR